MVVSRLRRRMRDTREFDEMSKVIRIERVQSRSRELEEPQFTAKGYCLGDPKHGAVKHHARNAVYAKTLEDAAELVEKGFSLRMVAHGKRASLVSPGALRIVRLETSSRSTLDTLP
jgi:hypothetical protein